jgi:(1->4)-alpha-D-glucan 1-alpha-D-glucosylmutase
VTGPAASHAFGFTRWGVVATVVPRLTLGLESWGDTSVVLPGGMWRNQLTGERTPGAEVAVADLFSRFPVALLRLET